MFGSRVLGFWNGSTDGKLRSYKAETFGKSPDAKWDAPEVAGLLSLSTNENCRNQSSHLSMTLRWAPLWEDAQVCSCFDGKTKSTRFFFSQTKPWDYKPQDKGERNQLQYWMDVLFEQCEVFCKIIWLLAKFKIIARDETVVICDSRFSCVSVGADFNFRWISACYSRLVSVPGCWACLPHQRALFRDRVTPSASQCVLFDWHLCQFR